MNIAELAANLNHLGRKDGHLIAELPILRKKFLHKQQLPDLIFHERTIFDQENYAFHYGGRDELQFNVGQDFIEEKEVTRICLALSLEASRSLKDPLLTLRPYWSRLVQAINDFPEEFQAFKLWYHTGVGSNRTSVGFFEPRELNQDWYKRDNFICLGKSIEKPLRDITEGDFKTILDTLDELLPVYNYCVLKRKEAFKIEERFARICWNEYDWTRPSGPYGKSHNTDAHEWLFGYGHEEWLFDFTRLVKEYHYCLLQSLENGRESFVGRPFNVRLYGHNDETKTFFWIGQINNLYVISDEAAQEIYTIYKDKNWIDEMALEIAKKNGDSKKFLSLNPQSNFNVRFRPEDVEFYVPSIPMDNQEFTRLINTHRYQFITVEEGSSFLNPAIPILTVERSRTFAFSPRNTQKLLTPRTSERQQKVIEIDPVHDRIQTGLFNSLVQLYGKDNVSMENDTGMRTRIDIVVQRGGKHTLYEVKSYPSVIISLRAAIGQLLEYAYWPEPVATLDDMIVVSHLESDRQVQSYLQQLRETSGLKIYYQPFDLKQGRLGEKV